MTRRNIHLLTVVALLLGAIGWVSATPTASAGGPTSVLMINPESGRASALHVRNPAYDRLYAAVGEPSGDAKPPSSLSLGAEMARLTWLIHDVHVWRVDRVYPAGSDEIWVETTVTDLTGEGDPFDQPSRWHRATDHQALTALLADAGLIGADPIRSSAPNPDDSSRATATASQTPPRPVAPLVGAAAGGLVIGAAGSLLLHRSRPTAAPPPRVTLAG